MRRIVWVALFALLLLFLQGCAPPNSFSGRYVAPTSGPTAHFLIANDSSHEMQVSTYRSAQNCYHKLGIVARPVGTSEAPTTVLIPAGRPASFTLYFRHRGGQWRNSTFTMPHIEPNERYAVHVVDDSERADRVGWRLLTGHPLDTPARGAEFSLRTGLPSPTREGLWCR
ncbi:hypothetical protein HUS23_07010 [Ectothiorhodospiraceae bacterium 2226]|nr:hypothetical protein HUS23_07010 [Ectothiorhodospiraceae bacterium 2226]